MKRNVIAAISIIFIFLSNITGKAAPVYSQTPTPGIHTYATPELSDTITFSGSVTNPPDSSWSFTSQELCGIENDLMGAAIRVTTSSNAAISLKREKDGSYVNFVSGGPITGMNYLASDWGYYYSYGNLPWAGTNVFTVGTAQSVLVGSYTVPIYWSSENNSRYSNGIRIAVGKWGGGTMTVSYWVRGVCSNTGEPPEPQKQHCNPVGKIESYEAIESTISRGALESVEIAEEYHEIDVSLNVVLPSAPVRTAANLSYTVFDQGLGMEVDSEELKIDGVTFIRQPGTPIGIPGQYPEINYNMIPVNLPGQSFTVDIKVTLRGQNIDGAVPYLGSLSISYQAEITPGESLICDTSMELYWDQAQHEPIPIDGSLSPWRELNDGENNGRFTPSWINALLQGGPTSAACNKKVHAVKTGTVNYSPIFQWFGWMGYGSTLYYKFRYQTGTGPLGIGNSNSSPNVYIVDVDGNFITDVYGYNQYTESLISRSQWTYVSGSITLAPGLDYALVLDGIPADPTDQYGKVFYDDVVIGTTSWTGMDDVCSNFMMGEVDFDPTPTPTLAPTSSPTPTITPTGTLATPTNTATNPPGTATAPPTVTVTRTQLASVTPRPTSSPWPTPTNLPSFTPRPATATKTPYGTPAYTNTPDLSWRETATEQAKTGTYTPAPTDDGWNGGDMPPDGDPVLIGDPGDGGGGDGWIYGSDCSRPTNPWSVSWWIDYEVCRTFNFVAIGPSHIATVQAVPTLFVNKEPIHTLNQFGQAAVIVRTQVASYDWEGTGGTDGQTDPQPGEILKYSGSSPWEAGATIDLPTANGNNFSGNRGQSEFSKYCNSRLSSALASRLAEGVCAVFNIYRDIGYLAWIQVFINIAAILGAFRAILALIGFGFSTQGLNKD